MSLEQWQVALRRQYAKEQKFHVENVGHEPIFSEFIVVNPETKGRYRVAIRGQGLGDNYCSCPDFAVNTLGTCKHIEFTLAGLARKRGAKKVFAEGFRPPYSEVYLRYGSQRQASFRAGAECPRALSELASRYFNEWGLLKSGVVLQFDTFLRQAEQISHELRCYDDALDFIAQVRDQVNLPRRIAKSFPKGIESPAFRNLLKVALYPYQRQGALFAANAGRALLADDMGLGKTVQAIAAIEMLARATGLERVLVISPTSLKHQWKQEIERFSARSALVVEGCRQSTPWC